MDGGEDGSSGVLAVTVFVIGGVFIGCVGACGTRMSPVRYMLLGIGARE